MSPALFAALSRLAARAGYRPVSVILACAARKNLKVVK